MSILNDSREFGTEEEYNDWRRDVDWEYRRQDYYDRKAEEQSIFDKEGDE